MTATEHRHYKANASTLLTRRAVKESLEKAGVLNSEQFVLVGLSGGADSLALAAAVAWLAERHSFTAGAVIVNHNLQEGSAEVAAEAARKARKIGLRPVIVKDVEVPASSDASGPENAAREARYEAFESAVDLTGASYILTAHTKNDNAEQVLISLARGSGVRSLAGIPEERDYILRPFVTSVGREDTVLACTGQGLDFWEDPQNSHEVYTRVRVRKNLIPALREELGEGVVDSLNRSAIMAKQDAEAFDWMVEHLMKDIETYSDDSGALHIPVDSIKHLPEALMKRVIRKYIKDSFDSTVTFEQTDTIAKLVTNWHGQKKVNAVGVSVERANGELRVFRTV